VVFVLGPDRGPDQAPVHCPVAMGTRREGLADTERDLLLSGAVAAINTRCAALMSC
jgi:hypothetical protein